jgi:hypothetical protein
MLNENGLAGRTALAFDGQNDRVIATEVPTGKSISAYCIAECPEISFNEHGWFASARMPNGYLLHPWRNEEQFHAEVLDNDGEYSGTNTLYIGDASAPHIYGLLYQQDSIYQTMQTVFDDQIQYQPGVNIGERIENALININMGHDFNDRYGEGMIAEQILFGERLMPVPNRIVTNYLAARYGIELGPLSLYHHADQPLEVIGIGMEGTHDRHTEAKGLSQLHVLNPQSLSAGDYLLIGQDAGSLAMQTALYPFTSARTERTFGFTETGDCGAVTLRMDASLFDQTSGLGIIYTTDDAFTISSPLTFVPLLLQGPVLEVEIDWPSNGVFTIGYSPSLTTDHLSQAQLQVYPNPADQTLQVELTQCDPAYAHYLLMDASGRMVMQAPISQKTERIDISNLPAGVYHLRLFLEEGVMRQTTVMIY